MGRTMFNRPTAGRVKGNGMGAGKKHTPNRKMKRVKNRGGGR